MNISTNKIFSFSALPAQAYRQIGGMHQRKTWHQRHEELSKFQTKHPYPPRCPRKPRMNNLCFENEA